MDGVKSPEPVWETDVTCRRVEENVAYEGYPVVVGPVRLDTGRRTAGERGLPDKWKAIFWPENPPGLKNCPEDKKPVARVIADPKRAANRTLLGPRMATRSIIRGASL